MSARHLTAVVTVVGSIGLLGACQPPPSPDAFSDADVMPGFSWVIDDELGAMPRPGRLRSLSEDLDFLADSDIELLISLTITPIDSDQLAARGIDAMHIPVVDFTAPTLEQMLEFVAETEARSEAGERVGVHCTGGLGRSGTMTAAKFVSLGLGPDEAIAEIRSLRPGSIETSSQERSIHDFAELLASEPL